jgi:hypothetical protein
LLVLGCEPARIGDGDNMQDGLSVPVRAAVGRAVDLVVSLVEKFQRGEAIEATTDNFNTIQGKDQCGEKQPVR